MTAQEVFLTDREKAIRDVKSEERARIPLGKAKKIHLRVNADFNLHRDIATFEYSLDGKKWTSIGGDFKMIFDYRRLFMGTKFGIFCYATKQSGGYVDIDRFDYER